MSRVTKKTMGVSKSNENNIQVTKNSNIPVPSKRKAEDELKTESKSRKRAAFEGGLAGGGPGEFQAEPRDLYTAV